MHETLEHVKADAAVDLTGDARAGGILAELMRTNAFVQPIGSGWYRYSTLFAEMLRLKLRLEHPNGSLSCTTRGPVVRAQGHADRRGAPGRPGR